MADIKPVRYKLKVFDLSAGPRTYAGQEKFQMYPSFSVPLNFGRRVIVGSDIGSKPRRFESLDSVFLVGNSDSLRIVIPQAEAYCGEFALMRDDDGSLDVRYANREHGEDGRLVSSPKLIVQDYGWVYSLQKKLPFDIPFVGKRKHRTTDERYGDFSNHVPMRMFPGESVNVGGEVQIDLVESTDNLK